MYYAYINEQGICHTVSDTKLEGAGTKELTVETMDVLGMKYENGEWVDAQPKPDPEPTQLDRIEETVNALTAESVTVEKLEAAITEGVNEV